MSFASFLTSMQTMFTGFEDNEEALSERQKICLLFEKVQSPNLTTVKNALQVSYDLDMGNENVTYDFIANSLATKAAILPNHVTNRQAIRVGSTGGARGAPSSGIRGPGGSIFTRFYKDFQRLSNEDKTVVIDKQKRLSITPNKSRGAKGGGRKVSSVKAKNKSLTKLTKQIATLKTRVKDVEGKNLDEKADDADEDYVAGNASDEFGGRSARRQKRDDSVSAP
jgi:hypothetical protein